MKVFVQPLVRIEVYCCRIICGLIQMEQSRMFCSMVETRNNDNTMKKTYYIGLDVRKDTIAICLCSWWLA